MDFSELISQVVSSSDWKLHERAGKQWGSLDALLNTRNSFRVVIPQGQAARPYHASVALEISRNLFQYFAADSEISLDSSVSNTTTGNHILLGFPDEFGIATHNRGVEFPISKSVDAIFLRDASGRRRRYPIEPGMGLAYLYPLPCERLGLVLWGADEAGLRAVSRLLPLRTGVGQPDFFLVGKEAGWGGVGGVRALGMFGFSWQISPAAYL